MGLRVQVPPPAPKGYNMNDFSPDLVYCEFYGFCLAMTMGNCSGRGDLDGSERCPYHKFSKRVRRRMLTQFQLLMVQAIDEN